MHHLVALLDGGRGQACSRLQARLLAFLPVRVRVQLGAGVRNVLTNLLLIRELIFVVLLPLLPPFTGRLTARLRVGKKANEGANASVQAEG